MTAVAVLTVLALAIPSSAVAQSAGDNQYSDPLAGGGEEQQRAPQNRDGDGDTVAPPPAPSAPAPATSPQTANDTPQASLPRTGADTGLLAGAGLALAALGVIGLGLARRPRSSRA